MRALALAICLCAPGVLWAQAVTAILEPAEIVEIRPTVTGRLLALDAREGAEVARGAALAQIDSRGQAQRVALARAVSEADGRVQRAEAQVMQAQALVTRMEQAKARNAAQDWEVEQAAQSLALALADRQIAEEGQEQARAQLALEQAILEDYTLRAPFDGVVLEVAVNTGASVDPQVVILTFAQLSQLEATAFVPLDWLTGIAAGDTMAAQVEGARVQDATVMVSAIDPRIDPASRTVRLRLMLDNAGGTYRPGATLILQPPLPSQ
ncbi:MAG: efflux RND transporter periplasmic adaptor subunit [Paracoccaceae bacterium]